MIFSDSDGKFHLNSSGHLPHFMCRVALAVRANVIFICVLSFGKKKWGKDQCGRHMEMWKNFSVLLGLQNEQIHKPKLE